VLPELHSGAARVAATEDQLEELAMEDQISPEVIEGVPVFPRKARTGQGSEIEAVCCMLEEQLNGTLSFGSSQCYIRGNCVLDVAVS